MTSMTDPATEISSLWKHLNSNSSQGDAVHRALAKCLSVEEWSSDLFIVVDIIKSRFDELKRSVEVLSLENDLLQDAMSEIKKARMVFEHDFMSNQNMVTAGSFLNEKAMRTIRLLAPQIRMIVSYPHIEADELKEISADIRDLIKWLFDHQLRENDFIRSALIEGLEQALFRLEKIHFFGWAYAASSLKPIITAYMALDRMQISNANNPDAEVVLKRVRQTCLKFYRQMKLGKEVAEVGDFALRLYGAASLAITPFVSIAGLLR